MATGQPSRYNFRLSAEGGLIADKRHRNGTLRNERNTSLPTDRLYHSEPELALVIFKRGIYIPVVTTQAGPVCRVAYRIQ